MNESKGAVIVGCLLVEPELMSRIAGMVTPDEFEDKRQGIVFSAIAATPLPDADVDLFTICDMIGDDKLEEIGGPAYIVDLVNQATHPLFMKYVAEWEARHASL